MVTVDGQHRENEGIGMFFKVGRFEFIPGLFHKKRCGTFILDVEHVAMM